MTTHEILDILREGNGVKCQTIVDTLNIPQNTISGILSQLKLRGIVYNHRTLWYVRNSVASIISKLYDIHGGESVDTDWSEGYVSALCDYKIINEEQFDKLLEKIIRG